MKIIFDINHFFLNEVAKKWPGINIYHLLNNFIIGDVEKLRRVSIIEEGTPRMVRMANLAIIASHSVNGVAEIHSSIIFF